MQPSPEMPPTGDLHSSLIAVPPPANSPLSNKNEHMPTLPRQPLRGSSRRRMWLALLAVPLVLVVIVSIFLPAKVIVVHPTPMQLRDEAVGTGFVNAKVLVGVGAKINGVVLNVHVDQGDPVRKGQILAELQNTDVRSQIGQADSQLAAQLATVASARANFAAAQARARGALSALEKAKAGLRLSEINLRRTKDLYAAGVYSKEALDSTETAYDQAAQEVANAEALYRAAEQETAAAEAGVTAAEKSAASAAAGATFQRANLEYTIVRSPVDGYVVTRDLEIGATVVPGLPIFTVAESSVIWVSANIDEREIEGLRAGQPATITLRSNPNRKIPGVVARVGTQADPVTEEVPVDVTFAQSPAGAKLNETAEVTILKAEKRQVLALPLTAVVRGPQGPRVWVVHDGRLGMRSVSLGVRDKRGFAEVLGGLESSDAVMMNPSAADMPIEPGKAVRTTVADMTAR